MSWMMRTLGSAMVVATLAVPAAAQEVRVHDHTGGAVVVREYPVEAPPAVRVESVAPRAGMVWLPGHHEWRGGAYVWVGGRYEPERAGYRYIPGRWERRGDRYWWVEGRWDAMVVAQPAPPPPQPVVRYEPAPPPPQPQPTVVVPSQAYPVEAPPPLRVERVAGPRGRGWVWVNGYWDWQNGRWFWVNGRWEKARHGHHWREHRWERQGDHWVKVEGGWVVEGR